MEIPCYSQIVGLVVNESSSNWLTLSNYMKFILGMDIPRGIILQVLSVFSDNELF